MILFPTLLVTEKYVIIYNGISVPKIGLLAFKTQMKNVNTENTVKIIMVLSRIVLIQNMNHLR